MTKQTSEVLDLAADAIQRSGWTQFNGWAGTTTWSSTIDLGSDPGGALCLEGGIMAAMGYRLGEPGINCDTVRYCPAYAAMQEYLDVLASRRLFVWNDKVGRTSDEVIEVLRAAAAVERVKESSYETDDQPLPLEMSA